MKRGHGKERGAGAGLTLGDENGKEKGESQDDRPTNELGTALDCTALDGTGLLVIGMCAPSIATAKFTRDPGTNERREGEQENEAERLV